MKKQIETERKFIIKMPNIKLLSDYDDYTESRITQIYLKNSDGLTRRVRRREYPSYTEFTKNTKRRISSMSSVEAEREISELEFKALSLEIEEGSSPLYKTRYTFHYLGKTIEIDVYPNWQSHAILECELKGEDDSFNMPNTIEIVREVTGEKKYSNHSMSRMFPEEPK